MSLFPSIPVDDVNQHVLSQSAKTVFRIVPTLVVAILINSSFSCGQWHFCFCLCTSCWPLFSRHCCCCWASFRVRHFCYSFSPRLLVEHANNTGHPRLMKMFVNLSSMQLRQRDFPKQLTCRMPHLLRQPTWRWKIRVIWQRKLGQKVDKTLGKIRRLASLPARLHNLQTSLCRC